MGINGLRRRIRLKLFFSDGKNGEKGSFFALFFVLHHLTKTSVSLTG